ncbi:MAG: hypothetical protein R2748_24660 [Bryobacterales bacterium]
MLRMLILTTVLAWPAAAQESALPRSRPEDWTCLVLIKSNQIGLPEESEDGMLRYRVFVATSSACSDGVVYVGIYPEIGCYEQPRRDPNLEQRMAFSYSPRALEIAVEAGNQAAGMFEIESPGHGICSFNTHIASCGTVVPAGAKCETRTLRDARAESTGAIGGAFNRVQ